MRRLLLSTAALLLLAVPAWAQPHGNRGEEHSNRVGEASVAPQVQDRAQTQLRVEQHGNDQGRGDGRRGEIRDNPPAAPSAPATLANRGERGSFGDRNDRRSDRRIENRGDRNRDNRERLSSGDRPVLERGRSDWNRDGRTDNRRGAYGPRHDFSGFRDYHRAFHAPRRFRADFYRRPAGWYDHRWAYGEVLPAAFWARDYWIVDFQEYDLPPPPYGAVWVRVGADALLIDEDSGEVITVAYDVFY
jgi:Ni/Co efflux regulator RcnB